MKFTDLLAQNLQNTWSIFKQEAELSTFVAKGIPMGIASFLKRTMINTKKAEASVAIGDILTISSNGKKRGNTLTINASLNLLQSGQALINADTLVLNEEAIEGIALSLLSEKELLEAVDKGCWASHWNDITGQWEKLNVNVTEGVSFQDDSDLSVAMVIYFTTILEVLVATKNRTDVATLEVDHFGKFTLELSRNNWLLGFTPTKEFKAWVKCDALGDILGEN